MNRPRYESKSCTTSMCHRSHRNMDDDYCKKLIDFKSAAGPPGYEEKGKGCKGTDVFPQYTVHLYSVHDDFHALFSYV
jgi:hypothetical protein